MRTKVIIPISRMPIMEENNEKIPNFVRSISKRRLSMSYQTQLPRLPVPDLCETLERYLLCVKPLVPEIQFEKTKQIVEAFGAEGGMGETLQRHLMEKAKKEVNWSYEWWLNDMYLRNRAPLPVNSNPGMVLPKQDFKTEEERLRFTAKLIAGIIDYKEILDQKILPVDVARGQLAGQPLCMQQYYRLLSTCRTPGITQDTLVTGISNSCSETPEHIIVALNNQFFVVHTMTEDEERLSEDEFLAQLKSIVKSAGNQTENTQQNNKTIPMGVLTSLGRSEWADARTKLRTNPVNRASVEAIERSIAVVCLDLPTATNNDDVALGQQMLHGGGPEKNSCNRWFDKTIQFIVGSEGTIGLVYEHSPSEGIAVICLIEHLLKHISKTDHDQKTTHTGSRSLQTPKRLDWVVDNEKVQRYMDLAKTSLVRMSNNLDLNILRFRDYGKDFIKRQNMSPDAYIQVALQLSFYMIYGHLVSTYESASTRRFRGGRVDNIRAATVQALDFAKSVTSSDPGGNSHLGGRKMLLLRRAIKAQTDFTIAAITGHGIDCHLVGLKEMSKELKLPLPELFKDPSYDICNYFTLSTSQVPTNTDSFMCYGAVVEDGYGVSYNPHSDAIVFCCASFRSCPSTCSEKFACAISDSLRLMKQLCLHWNRRRSSSLETIVVPRQLSIHRQMSPRSYSVDSDDLRERMRCLGVKDPGVEAVPEEAEDDIATKNRKPIQPSRRARYMYSKRRSGGILARERMHNAFRRQMSSDHILHGRFSFPDTNSHHALQGTSNGSFNHKN